MFDKPTEITDESDSAEYMTKVLQYKEIQQSNHMPDPPVALQEDKLIQVRDYVLEQMMKWKTWYRDCDSYFIAFWSKTIKYWSPYQRHNHTPPKLWARWQELVEWKSLTYNN